jgi:hypothetical protein
VALCSEAIVTSLPDPVLHRRRSVRKGIRLRHTWTRRQLELLTGVVQPPEGARRRQPVGLAGGVRRRSLDERHERGDSVVQREERATVTRDERRGNVVQAGRQTPTYTSPIREAAT